MVWRAAGAVAGLRQALHSQFQPPQSTRRRRRPMDRNPPENPVYSPDCAAQVWPIIATVPEERGPSTRAARRH
ncbi:hypothetical protein CBM2623_B170380 [Cupriavidus taiwanensis]|nr:hypothetical protein CBM2591_B10047 [Cupriavidus taiwanensis]SOZ28548.1 hypothetical protein CBM2608_B140448 [Cupriavidus taiwanensis]SPA33336.1 hypothetical protein CBM2623_B170380 [Cupriavidus taiwanensis]SPA48934.1 hypothetical protein CBM2629_B10316 [Cupriavidus taiwanensis]